MRTTRTVAFSMGALAGFAIGWGLAGRHREQNRAALFHPSRWRRLAALSHLAGQENPATIQLLRDYVAWEPATPLRWRAERMVRRMARVVSDES